MERYNFWKSMNPEASITEITNELRNIQTMASLRPADRVIIFLGATFSENFVAGREIEANKEVLAALGSSSILQRHLIGGFEWLCGTKYPTLIMQFPIVLKHLFDEDLVEDEVFFSWSEDLIRNEYSAEHSMMCLDTLEQLRNYSAPFIKWLEEAESDSEEDDEEEEES